MNKSIKTLILLSCMSFFAFTSRENHININNEYNLKNLKESHSPVEITMLKTDNISYGKNLLEKGILLTYKNRHSEKVYVSGDFTDWKPVKMNRGRYGVWYYFLNNPDTVKSLRYKFLVDGIWTNDPSNNNKEDDMAGSYISLIKPFQTTEDNMLSYKILSHGLIEFRLYNPEAKFISLVGDFNNWNPENDTLKKNENGIWSVRKKLIRGIYRYNYIIDGQWTVDLFNEKTGSNDMGDICSLINID